MMQLLFVVTRERNSLMKLEEILFLFLLCRLGLCFCSWNKKTCALATSSSALQGWIAVDLAAVHSCGRMGTFVRAVSAISTHRHRYTSPVIFPVPQGSSADVSVSLSVEQWVALVALGAQKCCSGQQETEGGSWIWLLFPLSRCFYFFRSHVTFPAWDACSWSGPLAAPQNMRDGWPSQPTVPEEGRYATSLLVSCLLQPTISLYVSSLTYHFVGLIPSAYP
jgi:hypothetical protein